MMPVCLVAQNTSSGSLSLTTKVLVMSNASGLRKNTLGLFFLVFFVVVAADRRGRQVAGGHFHR
ncbi:hypothetical protein EPYR_03781 [Erwinia pyrifoliae DSM 12163]|nr:hypothetical protein EPYR_03781 [Erwinia pyrifoliae DSM 12163]